MAPKKKANKEKTNTTEVPTQVKGEGNVDSQERETNAALMSSDDTVRVVSDSERCAHLNLLLARQTDDYSKLVSENLELKAQITALKLSVSALIQEKHQLLIELASERAK
jgi:hypothetical protein